MRISSLCDTVLTSHVGRSDRKPRTQQPRAQETTHVRHDSAVAYCRHSEVRHDVCRLLLTMFRVVEGSGERKADADSKNLRVRGIPPGTEEPIVQQAFERFAKVRRVLMEEGSSEATIEFEDDAVRPHRHFSLA